LQTSFDHTTDSASIPQFQTPAASIQTPAPGGDGNLMPMPKNELKALLLVDDGIAQSQGKSICVAYSKYKAANAAVQVYDAIVSSGKWPRQYQNVTVTEIRQLFISKTVWHSLYVPCFQDIMKYEEMVAWLESNGNDVPDDGSLWGYTKTTYLCADLKAWLEERKKKEKKEMAKAKKALKKSDEKSHKKKK
jgi:hypothetical protein